MDKAKLDDFHQLRAVTQKCLGPRIIDRSMLLAWTIWLVIKFDRDVMPISIVTKFGDDLVRIARVRERTK